MDLVRLFYVSTANPGVNTAAVRELVEHSAKANRERNITGALGFNNINFAQILEGERAAVTALYDRILEDKRHSGIVLLNIRSVSGRIYKDWGMKLITGLEFQELLDSASSSAP